MSNQQRIQIRVETPQEDTLIAEHFYQMWLDNNISPEAITSDWLETVLHFIYDARRELEYQAFVAEVDGLIVGSVSCQRSAELSPNIMKAKERRDGYIWGVYVQLNYRRQGIATQLTKQATDYLKTIGCTRVFIKASPSSEPVYLRLGFTHSNLMQLDF